MILWIFGNETRLVSIHFNKGYFYTSLSTSIPINKFEIYNFVGYFTHRYICPEESLSS